MADRPRNHTKLFALLDDLTDLEKVEAAKHVAATMATPGWAFLVQLLETRRAKQLDDLVRHAGVLEQAEYAKQLAEVRGGDVALDIGPTVLYVAERAARGLSESEGAMAR